ncbi:MAG: hypothetical protein ACN0LA_00795 [Candidatus Longimicrobiales bacterium M2_2A_002]
MFGFLAFVMIVVAGILALVGGLRFISASNGRGRTLPEADPQRLDRLESALGSLEARLDELQEEQRFLERLLAERPERRALGRGREGGGAGSPDVDSVLFDRGEGEGTGDR